MVDISAISGGLSALSAAKDITQGLMSLRDTAKFQSAVVELQGKILAAQSDQFTLLETVRELKEKMAQLEAWEAEKQRYQLTDYGERTFAYSLKPEASDGEPQHRLCAACFQQGKKGILQSIGTMASGRERVECPICKSATMLGVRSDGRRSNWT
jgi:hypothetical protein